MKKIIYGVSVTAIVVVAVSADIYFKKENSPYLKEEPLTERLGIGYKKLSDLVKVDERIGRNQSDVNSDLYQKNEGWLLRNQDIYCSNRLIDDVAKISADTGIKKFSANPNGTRMFMSIDEFKKNLGSLNELCVSGGEFEGEKVLEPTLFVSTEHMLWKRKVE